MWRSRIVCERLLWIELGDGQADDPGRRQCRRQRRHDPRRPRHLRRGNHRHAVRHPHEPGRLHQKRHHRIHRWRGGGFLSIYVATPLVYDCIVSNNASHRAGGAFQGTFHRCLIAQNYASNNGSGVRGSRLYDSLIVFNTGLGAVAYSQSTNDVVNCTIARNSSKALEQASAANSIIVENGSTANQGNYYVANCLLDFTPTSGYGVNNITSGGARFVDSANGDFRLLADSPALDAGNSSMTGFAPAPSERTDVYGHPRVQGAGLDLGAVEGAYPGAVVTVSASGSGTLDPAGSFLLPTLPTQHRRHAVQFILSFLAFGFVQRLSDNQYVLDRCAFQRRPPCDLEVAPAVRISAFLR